MGTDPQVASMPAVSVSLVSLLSVWSLLTRTGDAAYRPYGFSADPAFYPKSVSEGRHGGLHLGDQGSPLLPPQASSLIPFAWKRSASPDPDGLDLSVNLPFEMLRRRYVQALARSSMAQDREAMENL